MDELLKQIDTAIREALTEYEPAFISIVISIPQDVYNDAVDAFGDRAYASGDYPRQTTIIFYPEDSLQDTDESL